jgi:hypothetical protein
MGSRWWSAMPVTRNCCGRSTWSAHAVFWRAPTTTPRISRRHCVRGPSARTCASRCACSTRTSRPALRPRSAASSRGAWMRSRLRPSRPRRSVSRCWPRSLWARHASWSWRACPSRRARARMARRSRSRRGPPRRWSRAGVASWRSPMATRWPGSPIRPRGCQRATRSSWWLRGEGSPPACVVPRHGARRGPAAPGARPRSARDAPGRRVRVAAAAARRSPARLSLVCRLALASRLHRDPAHHQEVRKAEGLERGPFRGVERASEERSERRVA